ncbi:ligase-associated DNA damage response endonuclease PdeM [Rhodospirillales bacterium YIM 152171]|uniref:Ligase-associated DNA damage response endonuclease PdeM n=1 Tax=Marinimicrococcus flavescens TaxID=3031815 RepID=A0AAP3XSA9_9PROT|nr:ligase-associated DNA damage response endonuclease PdeM [Marinimicrococcus flavescens]
MAEIRVRGVRLVLEPCGAVWWPERRALLVADLHFEKGSAYARRGALLPPWDTAATLARLEAAVERRAPKLVVSLGDAFHDRHGPASLMDGARTRLAALARGRDWLWLSGNHDPLPPRDLGGEAAAALELDGLHLRHAPGPDVAGEIAGHLHPKARLATSRVRVVRPCFAGDGNRLLLPAFGSFTGGLNALHPAIAGLFPAGFDAWLLGERRVFRVPHARLRPEQALYHTLHEELEHGSE